MNKNLKSYKNENITKPVILTDRQAGMQARSQRERERERERESCIFIAISVGKNK